MNMWYVNYTINQFTKFVDNYKNVYCLVLI
jgi:hypothetical protein